MATRDQGNTHTSAHTRTRPPAHARRQFGTRRHPCTGRHGCVRWSLCPQGRSLCSQHAAVDGLLARLFEEGHPSLEQRTRLPDGEPLEGPATILGTARLTAELRGLNLQALAGPDAVRGVAGARLQLGVARATDLLRLRHDFHLHAVAELLDPLLDARGVVVTVDGLAARAETSLLLRLLGQRHHVLLLAEALDKVIEGGGRIDLLKERAWDVEQVLGQRGALDADVIPSILLLGLDDARQERACEASTHQANLCTLAFIELGDLHDRSRWLALRAGGLGRLRRICRG
mmetsp:Transcript_41182/g.123072  ORF Transcript_41182/g.123072 Transcript_41182/m.123072 type:complete len:288 (-) Transcript_41182:343-1206(-)